MPKKGNIPWNKGEKTGLIPRSAFKKGHTPWHTGTKGKKASPKTAFQKGERHSPNWYKVMVGRTPWNKGKDNLPRCGTCGNKLSGYKSKYCQNCFGEKQKIWKGNLVGYRSLHHWIQRKNGKASNCSVCGIIGEGHKIHWANISGKYMRKVDDFISLCAKCHGEFDSGRRVI